jgi:hypothetical protein
MPQGIMDVEDMSQDPYAIVVGSLMYAVVCIRLDIAHAVRVSVDICQTQGRNIGLLSRGS